MNQTLQDIIRQEITEKGPIPFARYQELCLYHPQLGYYQRQEVATGPSGDFYTAPHVHALFGHTVGQWIRNTASRAGWGEVTVLELGPGNGQLAQDILNHWEGGKPVLSMILLEEAGPRRRDLEARFRGSPVRVMDPDEIDRIEPFDGVVLTNEFFDALPLRIFTKLDGQTREVFVNLDEAGFQEILRQPGKQDGLLAAFLAELPEGYRTEVSDLWNSWLQRISRVLRTGNVLIIDYGDLSDGLILPWRSGGTLRCYRRHQVDTDPYEAPGEKDITAHVNFDLLEQWAIKASLERVSLVSQASFLIRAGILELLSAQMEKLDERQAMGLWLTVKNLVHDEEGMGEIFKAMVLKKE
jgi:SAM-dependent MidA family methyltransferase